MAISLWLAVALIVSLPGALIWKHQRKRMQVYEELTERVSFRRFGDLNELMRPQPTVALLAAEFEQQSVTRLPGFLTKSVYDSVVAEARSLMPAIERSYVPGHKKGGTVCYETICREAPTIASVFHGEPFRRVISTIVGDEVWPTPITDQSSCSLLYYTEPGDHIGWHFDHNFYRGRHFTVLICLVNRGPDGSLSASELQRQTPRGAEAVPLAENSLVVFEGARVRHRATAAAAGDLRVLLSMTFATDPRIRLASEVARRVKDTAFFGMRALWD